MKLDWKHINNWPGCRSRFFYRSFTMLFTFFYGWWTTPSNALKVFTCIISPNRLDNLLFHLQLYLFIVVSQALLCTIPSSILSFILVFFNKTVSIKARFNKVWFVRTGFRSKILVLILKVYFFSLFPQKSSSSLIFLINFLMFLILRGAYGNLR